MSPELLDVVIVGGGPAGSCAALALRASGAEVRLVERDRFPRHHIGESLLSRTVPYLKRLGVWDGLHDQGYVRKPGALFAWGGSNELMVLDMPPPGYSFQVPRADFDSLLLQRAENVGTDVRQEHKTLHVEEFDDHVMVSGDGPHGPWQAKARYLIDATGSDSLSARSLGTSSREYDGARIAVSAYFTGAESIAAPHEGCIITEASASGWIWLIPLKHDLVSVGLVSDARRVRAASSPQAALFEELASATHAQRHLSRATLRGEVQVIRYANHKMVDPKWNRRVVRAGDAAMFVDPLFSTGVHGAVYSGYMAGSAIASCLAGAVTEQDAAEAYNRYCDEYFERTRETVRLLYGFHPGTTPFWRDRAITDMTDEEAARSLKMLGVPGAAIFQSLKDELPMPEAFRRALSRVVWPTSLSEVKIGTRIVLKTGVDVRDAYVFQDLSLVEGHVIGSSDGTTASITISGGGRHARMIGDLVAGRAAGTPLGIRDHHSALLASALASSGNAVLVGR